MRLPEAYGKRVIIQKGRRTRELSERGRTCLGDATQQHAVGVSGSENS